MGRLIKMLFIAVYNNNVSSLSLSLSLSLSAAILIGEFLVSIFQDSEMFTGRQMLLNENRFQPLLNCYHTFSLVASVRCFCFNKFKMQP